MMARRILIITTLVILAGGWGVGISAYQTLTDPVPITGQAIIPITPGSLLDDFSKGTSTNLWGCTTSTVTRSGTSASIAVSYPSGVSLPLSAVGRCMQLSYNVSDSGPVGDPSPGSWAAYVTSLGGVGIGDYKYLSFWVKGAAGGEYFKVEVHHANYDYTKSAEYNNDYKAEVYVTDYLDGGVTTGWKKVVIPLDAFANINSVNNINGGMKMKELVFAFEYSQSNTNGSPKSGTIYVSNISFGKQFLGFVRIDHFGDKFSKNALGGDCGVSYPAGQGVLGTFAYTDTAGQFSGYPCGLNFHFQNNADPNYFAYVSKVGGGGAGSVSQSRNFSAYKNLSFAVKSDGTAASFKIELHCPTYISGDNYFHLFKRTATSSWNTLIIPLEQFTTTGNAGSGASVISSGKISALAEIIITRDGWMSNPTWYDWDAGVYTGTFYFDKMQLQIDNYAPDTTLPAQPSAPSLSVSGSKVTVASSAYSRFLDPSIEGVIFYWSDSFYTYYIGADYDTEDANYSATWDTTGVSPGSYSVRAIAVDAAGNIKASTATTYTKS